MKSTRFVCLLQLYNELGLILILVFLLPFYFAIYSVHIFPLCDHFCFSTQFKLLYALSLRTIHDHWQIILSMNMFQQWIEPHVTSTYSSYCYQIYHHQPSLSFSLLLLSRDTIFWLDFWASQTWVAQTVTLAEELTRMLSLPSNSEDTVSINFSRSALIFRSHTEPLTLSPLLFHSWILSLSSVSFREHVCTIAPNAVSSSTIAYLINQSLTQSLRYYH